MHASPRRTRLAIPAILAALIALLFAASASATPLGSITETGIQAAGGNAGASVSSLAPGSDGNLWFIDSGTTKSIDQYLPAFNAVVPYTAGLNAGARPGNNVGTLVPGPDGDLWFTDQGTTTKAIGKIDPATGAITEYSAGFTAPQYIAPGPDGNLWFTDNSGVSEQQSVTIAGATDAVDTFTLGNLPTPTCSASTTGAITYSADPATLASNIQTALQTLCGGGSNIGVATGPPPSVSFVGALGSQDIPTMSCAISGTLGDSCTIATTTPGASNSIGKITPSGTVTEYSAGLNGGAKPTTIAPGADGNLWFTDVGATRAIGKINPTTGAITEYSGAAGTGDVSAGSNTVLNATATRGTFTAGNSIFGTGIPADTTIVSVSGSTLTLSNAATGGSAGEAINVGIQASTIALKGIAPGADGNLWFIDPATGSKTIDRIAPDGTITAFSLTAAGLPSNANPINLVAAADGNLWFADQTVKSIDRVTPAGAMTQWVIANNGGQVHNLPVGTGLGPDGNVWFGDFGSGGGVPSIGEAGVGKPAASVRAPSVLGGAGVGAPQSCGNDRWATWAGDGPFDGGLLSSSTSPPPVQWTVNNLPVGTDATYIPVVGDLGKTLKCAENVTYRLPLNVTANATSAGVTVTAAAAGATGATGATGSTGATGATGSTGSAGNNGATGAAGPAGANGAQGSQGPQGAQGSQGPQGAQGPAGPTGKVVCKAKLKGKKVTVTCQIKTAKRANLRWSLRRNGHTVRHGATHGRLNLTHLRKGHYRLHVQGAKGSTVVVVG